MCVCVCVCVCVCAYPGKVLYDPTMTNGILVKMEGEIGKTVFSLHFPSQQSIRTVSQCIEGRGIPPKVSCTNHVEAVFQAYLMV